MKSKSITDLPQYIQQKIDSALSECRSEDSYWNDWEISVTHYGSPSESVSYYGKDLDEAFDTIPKKYYHIDKGNAELIVLSFRREHQDEHGDVKDLHYVLEIEFFWG